MSDDTSLTDAYDALYDDYQRLVAALTPSGDTKAAYMGEVVESVSTLCADEEGNVIMYNRPVGWTAIKAVMALIRKEAGL